MQKYKWKQRRFGDITADVAAKELCDIQKKHGSLTPDVVVKEAKKKRSPIHDCFEWDDTTAAAKYRVEQAKYLIRTIEVVFTGDDDECEPLHVRAFHSIVTEDDSREYVTLKQAQGSAAVWDQVKQQALDALLAWKTKYAAFKEFEQLYVLISKLTKK